MRERFLPDPGLDRAAQKRLQREVARAAVFTDEFAADPSAVRLETTPEAGQTTVTGGPTVVGVDQAFRNKAAVSAAVAIRGGRVLERAAGRAPVETEYVPGLLSFREAPAILDALESLSTDPDLLVLDGSGRIHFRQAGIATHVGVLRETPAVGVAKSLLCGHPRDSLTDPLAEGTRVAIEAGDDVERRGKSDPDWPVIGHAYQSRQYADTADRHVNPLYVSPGHRVTASTATDLVAALSAGYKLPEPTRLADAHADTL